MSCREEFPDFDPATLPPIPADWVDISWHNDACPSWANEKAQARVFVNYLDLEDREYWGGGRFCVLSTADATLDHDLLQTDNWDEVLDLVRKMEGG